MADVDLSAMTEDSMYWDGIDLTKVDIDALVQQFVKEYGFLHETMDGGGEVAGFMEAFRNGDDLIAERGWFVRQVAARRGDSFDSSIEVAALAFALFEVADA